jgi:ribosomal-protein-serine acetyltransferase
MSEAAANGPVLLPLTAGTVGDVTVRAWEHGDAPGLVEAVASSHDHLHPWMPWVGQPPISIPERLEWIDQTRATLLAGGDAIYGIFLGDQVAGGSGLHRRIGEGGLEIGYWVHAGLLRRGIATTTVRILTAAAFSLPGIDRVEIHHDKANAVSARVAAAAGYRFVTEVADEPEAPGEVGIECRWRLERDQWRR